MVKIKMICFLPVHMYISTMTWKYLSALFIPFSMYYINNIYVWNEKLLVKVIFYLLKIHFTVYLGKTIYNFHYFLVCLESCLLWFLS